MDKNIIRIKEFPSNTIDEAILILKDNKKAKKYECTSKFKNTNCNKMNNEEMVIKEAEFIISNYIDKNELDKSRKKQNKLKRLKISNFILGAALLISIIL